MITPPEIIVTVEDYLNYVNNLNISPKDESPFEENVENAIIYTTLFESQLVVLSWFEMTGFANTKCFVGYTEEETLEIIKTAICILSYDMLNMVCADGTTKDECQRLKINKAFYYCKIQKGVF